MYLQFNRWCYLKNVTVAGKWKISYLSLDCDIAPFRKNFQINSNVILKSIERKDTEHLYRIIDESWKRLIEVAIIRIMKAHQTSKHALLVQEVIQQLSSRFKLNYFSSSRNVLISWLKENILNDNRMIKTS